MSKHESWHLFIAPLYIEKASSTNPHDAFEEVENLKKSIMNDSHFKLKERRFHIETPNDYNVFQYFFDDARRSIFWFDEQADNEEKGAIQFRLNVTDRPYKQEDAEPIGELLLRIYESDKNPDSSKHGEFDKTKAVLTDEIQLELMDVDIMLYQFNVGHVSFLCRYIHPGEGPDQEENFYKYILMINDRMRRLYLHWLSKGLENSAPDDLEGRICAQVDGRAPYHDVRIAVRDKYCNKSYTEADIIEEDYSACLVYEELDVSGVNRPVLLEAALGGMEKRKLGCSFELLEDNRMFTAAYILPKHLDAFLNVFNMEDVSSLNESERWHKLLTVDTPKNSMITNNDAVRLETIKNSTYVRWLDSDDVGNTTLFGYTKHSFIMVGDRTNFHFKNVVKLNFLHQYSEMARLVLAQTAAVHRFGRVIYDLSGKISTPKAAKDFGMDQKTFREVSEFKQNFNDFVNRLFFKEITSQIQGGELYKLLQGKQEINSYMNELKEEINQLSDHLEMLQRQSQEKSIHLLTQTTIILGVLTFITGFYGTNFLAIENGRMIMDIRAFGFFGIVLVLSFFAASYMPGFSRFSFTFQDRLRSVFKRNVKKGTKKGTKKKYRREKNR